mmetsp:Transcript_21937/g.67582  ORF Transcript_21937/g.67582 Transcript_21937/m.67582 type:complete len:89 (+) Transcript_21937:1357-1623(+)
MRSVTRADVIDSIWKSGLIFVLIMYHKYYSSSETTTEDGAAAPSTSLLGDLQSVATRYPEAAGALAAVIILVMYKKFDLQPKPKPKAE